MRDDMPLFSITELERDSQIENVPENLSINACFSSIAPEGTTPVSLRPIDVIVHPNQSLGGKRANEASQSRSDDVRSGSLP
jgi:hypothetical protein